MGPTYCETPLAAFVFPAEPINTLTNLVIIAFGVVALYLVYRRAPRAADLWAIAVFLTATGVGSLLWHGFRTSAFLTLDFTPGMLCLLAILYAWSRRLEESEYKGVFWIIAFLVLVSAGSTMVGWLGEFRFFFAGPLVATLLIGGYFIYRSYKKWDAIAGLTLLGMGTALLALMFRSIDGWACSYIPFGTHFLWHILLSLGAFLMFFFLLKTATIKNPASE